MIGILGKSTFSLLILSLSLPSKKNSFEDLELPPPPKLDTLEEHDKKKIPIIPSFLVKNKELGEKKQDNQTQIEEKKKLKDLITQHRLETKRQKLLEKERILKEKQKQKEKKRKNIAA